MSICLRCALVIFQSSLWIRIRALLCARISRRFFLIAPLVVVIPCLFLDALLSKILLSLCWCCWFLFLRPDLFRQRGRFDFCPWRTDGRTDGRTDRNYFEKTGVALLRTTSLSKLKLSDEAWISPTFSFKKNKESFCYHCIKSTYIIIIYTCQ